MSDSPHDVSSDASQKDSGLRQIVYASTATRPSTYLDDILRAARPRNRERGITGLLLHTPDRFMQYLEGPSEAVAELFATISADPRHHSISVLADAPIAERSFGGWDMAAAEVDTMAWLALTLASWPRSRASDVRVEGPSGIRMLEEFRPAPAEGEAAGAA